MGVSADQYGLVVNCDLAGYRLFIGVRYDTGKGVVRDSVEESQRRRVCGLYEEVVGEEEKVAKVLGTAPRSSGHWGNDFCS